ncbi:hypothetical protein SAMN05421823_101328 [Catalinimonas alkaloidigena]|uniref:Uncharacterized protein n=1 Tax=Catalinimonas alkaloidigena TaxID=1075417 RepID=A0A1G8XC69_9BACT|nr:hypothetical protein [Catalinimonas alkaloidigena]SDJ88228.1 hypothetical protein SAMN05421823_101328 [Catalinimonas alkaloidigena]
MKKTISTLAFTFLLTACLSALPAEAFATAAGTTHTEMGPGKKEEAKKKTEVKKASKAPNRIEQFAKQQKKKKKISKRQLHMAKSG